MTTKALAIALLALIINGCNSKDVPEEQTPPINDTSGVEKNPPNTTYKPAFAGQTRIAAVTTTAPYETKLLSSSLNSPWGIAALPDGRFLITEKRGSIRIASADGSLSPALAGAPTDVLTSGQAGYLGITIDPGFASNRIFYWVYSRLVPDGNLPALTRARLSDDETSLEDVQVIYEAKPAHGGDAHYGGRVKFDGNGYLYMSTGERSDINTRPFAQSLETATGKVLRLTRDGAAAPGNPFASRAGALPEIYSYGHRNPQGLAISTSNGHLWQSEMGPRGGDEINYIEPGRNYGWPIISYGIEYTGEPVGRGITQQDGMEQPVYYWDPVISCSGITFYNGQGMPEWKDNLFLACLSGMQITRLVISNNKVVGEERLLQSEQQRFRDITQGADGALYAVTDGGRLYRIGTPK